MRFGNTSLIGDKPISLRISDNVMSMGNHLKKKDMAALFLFMLSSSEESII